MGTKKNTQFKRHRELHTSAGWGCVSSYPICIMLWRGQESFFKTNKDKKPHNQPNFLVDLHYLSHSASLITLRVPELIEEYPKVQGTFCQPGLLVKVWFSIEVSISSEHFKTISFGHIYKFSIPFSLQRVICLVHRPVDLPELQC